MQTSKADWLTWASTADEAEKDAVRTLWAALGPMALVGTPPTRACRFCAQPNWTPYGTPGSDVCPDCRPAKGVRR